MHLPQSPGTGCACTFHGYEHGQHHRQCRAERGSLCTFQRYRALVLLAPSAVMGTVRTTTCFSYAIPIASPPAFLYGVEP